MHIYLNWHVRSEVQTTILNLGWTAYNMLILGASVAAASERRQIRAVHRVAMKMPVMLKFSTGRTLACETIDYSEGGVGVELPANIEVPMHERVTVSLFRGDEEYAFPATVGFTEPGRVGLRFSTMTREQEYEFVKTTFARADAWTGWAEGRQQDTPLRGLSHVLLVGARGIAGLFEHLYADLRSSMTSRPIGRQEAENQKTDLWATGWRSHTSNARITSAVAMDAELRRLALALATIDARACLLAGFADRIGGAAGVGGRTWP